jgi:hypothetical protein
MTVAGFMTGSADNTVGSANGEIGIANYKELLPC